MENLRKRLEELWEKNSKNKRFFEDLGIKKDNFRKLFTENGNPGAKTLLKISKVAGVSMAWLFGETEERDYRALLDEVDADKQRLRGEIGKSDKLMSSLEQLVDTQKKLIEDKDTIINMKDERIRELQSQVELLQAKVAQIPLLASTDKADGEFTKLSMSGKTAGQKNIGAQRK